MASTRPIRCPRCGYDQHGVIASWVAACPLRTACAECGLAIEWSEVLSPVRRRPAWCVEYARRWWHVPWRTAHTLLMALRPWRFWRELRMSHEPRWARLAAMLALVALLPYLTFAASVGGAMARDCLGWGSTPSQAIACGLYAAALPLSSAPPARYFGGPAGPMSVPRLFASAFAVSSEDLGTAAYALLLGFSRDDALGTRLATVAIGAAVVLTAPIGFLALPVSRRRAKVRWIHVARIALYSVPLPALVLTYAIARYVLTDHGPWWQAQRLDRELRFVIWGLVPLALLAWWTFAVQRYLRIPHAFPVAASLVTLGLLLGPGLILLVLCADLL